MACAQFPLAAAFRIRQAVHHAMTDLPPCPKCSSTFTWLDREHFHCPECDHEWTAADAPAATTDAPRVVKDANGTVLQDGDTVTVIKDLKVRGASSSLKVGTKVRNIRIVDGDHDIDCKIDGFGAMQLKSEYVRKVT
jgi:protein PhnA